MSSAKILAMSDLPFDGAQWKQLSSAAAPDELVIVDPNDTGGVANALEKVEIALLTSDLDERYLSAPKLKWIHCDHAGLNGSAWPDVFDKHLIVTGSAGRSGPALAEHALMFLLALTAKLPAFYDAQRRREWGGVAEMKRLRPLYRQTMGIIGMGHTGAELAKRAKALDMHVLGYRRRHLPPPMGVDRMYSAEQGETIDEILVKSDAVILATSLNDSSYRMIGKRELALMKPNAFLVNLARGAVVDEAALIEALTEGRLAGAGLDVFEVEPLSPDSGLWHAPNTLITPHFTPASPDRAERSLAVILENFRRYRTGEELKNSLKQDDVFSAVPPSKSPKA